MAREAGARLELLDREQHEDAPKLAVSVIGGAGEETRRAAVAADGSFRVTAKELEGAREVRVVPAELPAGTVDAPAVRLRPEELHELLRGGGALQLPRDAWQGLLIGRRCVEGGVVACNWLPSHVWQLELRALRPAVHAIEAHKLLRAELGGRRLADAASKLRIAEGLVPPPPIRCTPVCEGVVEVYRRRCCCEPWIIDDPRLPEVIRALEELVRRRVIRLPIIARWPPPPPPPPLEGPLVQPEIVEAGALDERMLNAGRDLGQLRSLRGRELVDYVEGRPYLRPFWCSCGTPARVGEGVLRPDGSFRVCWWQPLFPIPIRPFCHDEYAFVVKQPRGERLITIYNGLATGHWFDQRSGIRIASYDWRARGCQEDPFPDVDGAFAVLERIGSTTSNRLKSPVQTGWDSVAPPTAYNDGLRDPAPSPGQVEDANWGGDLALHYHFSPELEATGAFYYRVSVVRAGPDGAPVASTGDQRDERHYFGDSLSWRYFTDRTPVQWLAEQLGPNVVEGEPDLYRIPYRHHDRDWNEGQPSAIVRTRAFRDDRHLVTLELFDRRGRRLDPATGGFQFLRLNDPGQPLTPVPREALTHLFWWDNRRAFAHIEDLRIDGGRSGGECQFIVADDTALFSVGYRAYHENPLFIRAHQLEWTRGIGGGHGVLESGTHNAGQPPDLAAVTERVTMVGEMLGPERKCAFALDLRVSVKTTDGAQWLDYLGASDEGAFALQKDIA